MSYIDIYNDWITNENLDKELKEELLAIQSDDAEIKERFGAELSFGTAGLRGIIAAGTNRMNIYVVRRATRALASYIAERYKNPSVVIGYDSRNKSYEFAKVSAETLTCYGIKVYLFEELKPVPEVSFATRYLKCSAGIMITASHNPAKYNGYKVYGDDGCQIGPETADYILNKINSISLFEQPEGEIKPELIEMIGDNIENEFLRAVVKQQINPDACKKAGETFKIIYTPFHGTGYKPVMKVFDAIGIKNVYTVEEQCVPDGDFPTVKSPNPEDKEGFALAIDMARKLDVDLIVGTDPDCDRVGIVVKNSDKEYVTLTGNQVGALLCEYILSQRKEQGTMPENPFVAKTIVTTDIIRSIASNYGVKMFECLTGFKYIGELIKNNEEDGDMHYVFGFEESYGYLAGIHARDKDGVVASMLIAEMAAFYNLQSKTLYDALNDLYNKYGWYKEGVSNIVREGLNGVESIKNSMKDVRSNLPEFIAGHKVLAVRDYSAKIRHDNISGKDSGLDLPKSDVIYFEIDGGMWAVLRPSGTEPKLKIYVGAKADSEENAVKVSNEIVNELKTMVE